MNGHAFHGIADVCKTHAERLTWAKGQLAKKQPFTPESLASLSNEELAIFDQFVVRFSKLQDVMGAKLFPAILELTHEEGDLEAFIDKLNRLEKLGALDSVPKWLMLREMRNQFAHDYPDDPAVRAILLNKAFALAEDLLQIFVRANKFAHKYID